MSYRQAFALFVVAIVFSVVAMVLVLRHNHTHHGPTVAAIHHVVATGQHTRSGAL